MPDIKTLADAIDDGAILSYEHQIHLGELVGDRRFSAELGVPTAEFVGGRSIRCTRVHLLGTAAPGPRSWLWGWAHPAQYPEQVTELSVRVREFGLQHGIAELAEAEVPFDALSVPVDSADAGAEPRLAGALLVDAAKVLTGCWSSYIPRVSDGGKHVALLVEHPDFHLPPPRPERVARIIQHSLIQPQLTDHRRALHSYAVQRGLTATFNTDRSELTLDTPGLQLVARFDESGRVVDLHLPQPPASPRA